MNNQSLQNELDLLEWEINNIDDEITALELKRATKVARYNELKKEME
jgi:chorismate mutase